MIEDPFDFLASEDATIPTSTSVSDRAETTTYGQLVNEIQTFQIPIYPYYDDYLNVRSSAPIEEDRPSEFVSQDSPALASGAEFEVFPGQLFQNFDSLESSGQSNSSYSNDTEKFYGDFKFVKPSSGASVGSSSAMVFRSPPRQVSVALKVSVQSINKSDNRHIVLGSFLKEIRVMGKLKLRPSIVEVLGVAFVKQEEEVRPTLVVELALGNTFDFFRSPLFAHSINWKLKSRLCLNVADALQAIHAIDLVHADVKGKNVLIFPDDKVGYCAKLSDFGSCVPMGSAPPRSPGTRDYLAPECLLASDEVPVVTWFGNSHYRDLYALGLFVWELATDCKYDAPFRDSASESRRQLLKSSTDGAAAKHLLASVPDITPQHFRTIICGSLVAAPTQRMSLEVILESVQTSLEDPAPSLLVSKDPPLENITASPIRTETAKDIGTVENSESLVRIPWSLQERLFGESEDPSKQNMNITSVMDSKVYLAYCYVLCSERHQLRDQALKHIRRAAQKNPFHLVQGSRLTPFAVMLQLQDWEGLSDLLANEPCMIAGELSSTSEQFLSHIFSFGWKKLIMFACKAGAVDSPETSSPQSSRLQHESETAALSSIGLLTAGKQKMNISETPADSNGLAALHWASLSGKSRLVEVLVNAGFDLEHGDNQDRTPLHLCCQSRFLSDDLSLDVATKMVENRRNIVNAVMKGTLYTPLRFAVDAQKPRLCEYLVIKGADVNVKAKYGSTPLQECAWVAGFGGNGCKGEGDKDEQKALKIADILLTHGTVNIDEKSCHNSVTALGVAAAHGNFTDMVSLLLDHGANPNTAVDGVPALSCAVWHDNERMISLLLENGVDLNFAGPKAIYPVGLAVEKGNHELVSTLVRAGANMDVFHRGELLIACAVALTEIDEVTPILKLLLDGGAAVTMPQGGPCRYSPVHVAASWNRLNVLRALLDHHASILEREEGRAVLHSVAVAFADNAEAASVMINFLVDNGAELDAIDDKGQTALHRACRYRIESMITCLLDKGIDRKIRAVNGETARDVYLRGKRWLEQPPLDSTLSSLEFEL